MLLLPMAQTKHLTPRSSNERSWKQDSEVDIRINLRENNENEIQMYLIHPVHSIHIYSSDYIYTLI
jgi:hypothetical protein